MPRQKRRNPLFFMQQGPQVTCGDRPKYLDLSGCRMRGAIYAASASKLSRLSTVIRRLPSIFTDLSWAAFMPHPVG